MVTSRSSSDPRRAVAAAVAAAAVCLMLGGVAFACTAQATLSSNVAAGDPGTNVSLTGRGYQTATASSPVAPVDLRWGGAAGVLLAQAVPDDNGNISAQVTVPANAAPGPYVITARQKVVTSAGVEGFIGSAVAFEVGGAPAPAPPAPAAVPQQPQATPQPAVAPAPAPAAAPQPAAAPVSRGAVADSSRTVRRPAPAPAAPAQAPATPAPVAVAAPEVAPAPVPAPAAPAPEAVRPARVADQPTVAVTMKARSSSDASPWLAPMILIGVALAVASSAIVAKDSRRRRVETAKAEVNKLG